MFKDYGLTEANVQYILSINLHPVILLVFCHGIHTCISAFILVADMLPTSLPGINFFSSSECSISAETNYLGQPCLLLLVCQHCQRGFEMENCQ